MKIIICTFRSNILTTRLRTAVMPICAIWHDMSNKQAYMKMWSRYLQTKTFLRPESQRKKIQALLNNQMDVHRLSNNQSWNREHKKYVALLLLLRTSSSKIACRKNSMWILKHLKSNETLHKLFWLFSTMLLVQL